MRWAHLGVLGPLLRAEVGDTIRVVFRNHATRSYSMHPHGVFYRKDSEGTSYLDGTRDADRMDDSVPPGRAHVHVAGPRARRTGGRRRQHRLLALPLARRRGEGHQLGTHRADDRDAARHGARGRLVEGVDREFVADFGLFDEFDSWYLDTNVVRLYGDAKKFERDDAKVREFHHFFTINGFLEGNGPMLTMRQGERVRWYLFTDPNEQNAWDIHSPHWHGQTLVREPHAHGHDHAHPDDDRVADMVPDNPVSGCFIAT